MLFRKHTVQYEAHSTGTTQYVFRKHTERYKTETQPPFRGIRCAGSPTPIRDGMDLYNVSDDLKQHIRIAHRLSLDWREKGHKREKQRDLFIDIFLALYRGDKNRCDELIPNPLGWRGRRKF